MQKVGDCCRNLLFFRRFCLQLSAGRLQEIAAWNFVNHEAIQNTRPWVITHENNIWFTTDKDQPSTVYAYLTGITDWPRGDRKTFKLKSVKAKPNSKISVLGQTGKGVVNTSFSEFGLEYRAVIYQDGLRITGNVLDLK